MSEVLYPVLSPLAYNTPRSARLHAYQGESRMHVKITINGQLYEKDVEPRLLLTHFIRDIAGLTGTHIGCETSICGACTVLANGLAVKSCTMFAVQADGADV